METTKEGTPARPPPRRRSSPTSDADLAAGSEEHVVPSSSTVDADDDPTTTDPNVVSTREGDGGEQELASSSAAATTGVGGDVYERLYSDALRHRRTVDDAVLSSSAEAGCTFSPDIWDTQRAFRSPVRDDAVDEDGRHPSVFRRLHRENEARERKFKERRMEHLEDPELTFQPRTNVRHEWDHWRRKRTVRREEEEDDDDDGEEWLMDSNVAVYGGSFARHVRAQCVGGADEVEEEDDDDETLARIVQERYGGRDGTAAVTDATERAATTTTDDKEDSIHKPALRSSSSAVAATDGASPQDELQEEDEAKERGDTATGLHYNYSRNSLLSSYSNLSVISELDPFDRDGDEDYDRNGSLYVGRWGGDNDGDDADGGGGGKEPSAKRRDSTEVLGLIDGVMSDLKHLDLGGDLSDWKDDDDGSRGGGLARGANAAAASDSGRAIRWAEEEELGDGADGGAAAMMKTASSSAPATPADAAATPATPVVSNRTAERSRPPPTGLAVAGAGTPSPRSSLHPSMPRTLAAPASVETRAKEEVVIVVAPPSPSTEDALRALAVLAACSAAAIPTAGVLLVAKGMGVATLCHLSTIPVLRGAADLDPSSSSPEGGVASSSRGRRGRVRRDMSDAKSLVSRTIFSRKTSLLIVYVFGWLYFCDGISSVWEDFVVGRRGTDKMLETAVVETGSTASLPRETFERDVKTGSAASPPNVEEISLRNAASSLVRSGDDERHPIRDSRGTSSPLSATPPPRRDKNATGSRPTPPARIDGGVGNAATMTTPRSTSDADVASSSRPPLPLSVVPKDPEKEGGTAEVLLRREAASWTRWGAACEEGRGPMTIPAARSCRWAADSAFGAGVRGRRDSPSSSGGGGASSDDVRVASAARLLSDRVEAVRGEENAASFAGLTTLEGDDAISRPPPPPVGAEEPEEGVRTTTEVLCGDGSSPTGRYRKEHRPALPADRSYRRVGSLFGDVVRAKDSTSSGASSDAKAALTRPAYDRAAARSGPPPSRTVDALRRAESFPAKMVRWLGGPIVAILVRTRSQGSSGPDRDIGVVAAAVSDGCHFDLI